MLGTKSRWPGASSTFTSHRSERKKAVPTWMVTPRARSSSPWSSTHANLNDGLPHSRDSFSYRWMVR
eukprot:214613-Prymnesium_polylepis.1